MAQSVWTGGSHHTGLAALPHENIQSDGQRNCRIHIKFDKEYDIHRVVLKENIKKSQRIEAFRILTVHDGSEKCIFEGTVVGYKKIALLDEIKTKELVIEIIDSRVAPTLSYIGIFE